MSEYRKSVGILAEIVARKQKRLDEAKRVVPLSLLQGHLSKAAPVRDFRQAISRGPEERVKLIAEVKHASPSKGVIRHSFNVPEIATTYCRKGASAISVLTEEDYFQGRLEYILVVKEHCHLPVLRKDFLFDEYQIYEARAWGADAVLLIAAVLSKLQASELISLAHSLGMAVLFEIHDDDDLQMATDLKVSIVGINNRNLSSMSVDIGTTPALVKDIPEGCVVVSESGFSTGSDVGRVESIGVHAILVGSALMSSENIDAAIDRLLA